MPLPLDMTTNQKMRKWSGYLNIALVTIAFLVLLGWQFNIYSLRTFLLPPLSMNPLTAINFILLGCAVWLLKKPSTAGAGYFLVAVPILTGLLKILAFAFAFDFAPDAVLYGGQLNNDAPLPTNRMAPMTAVGFMLAGTALLIRQTEIKKRKKLSHCFVLAIAGISLLSLLGYLYQVKSFYSFLGHISMAASTALGFFIFSLLVLFAEPGEGIMKEFSSTLSGSLLARLMIPAALVIPSVLGLLRLQGYWANLYSNEFGTAMFVLSIIIIFICITWYYAYLLNQRDLLKKQTEDALRDSERHIQAIFHNAPDAVVVINSKGRVTKWNTEAETLFGWQEEEVTGRPLSELIIPEEFREAHKKGLQRYLDTGESIILGKTIDILGIRKDGSRVDVSLRVSPLVLGEEKVFIGFIRDITDRKEMENRLKRFNEELSLQVEEKTSELSKARDIADKLIDSLPGVFYFFDGSGRFIRWNKEFERVTGYNPGEISEMHPTDFFGEEHKSYIAERIAGVFHKGINDAEASFLTKDGKRIPYFFKATLIHYEGKPCLLGTGIDIAERKKSEGQLIESERKYKLLFESNPLPMWMLSLPEYEVIDVNNAALELYGYNKEEFLNLTVYDFRPPEDIPKLRSATNTAFRGIHHAGIWRHIKKDRTLMYVDIVTYDLTYLGKQTRLVLSNNVTEKYIAEEKLKESLESIRTLTGHLQNVREEERLYMSREIHDELGQLITVLKMDISWLNKKIGPANEAIKTKLTDILGVVDTTAKTVRRIASELRPSLLDDLGLLAAMEWHLEEFERRSGISKELHLPETEIQLPNDFKIGIFRIFQESLTNVARHSGADKVIVNLKQQNKQLILTIQDNGKGFEEKGNKKTLGLLGMKERSQMMGGQYDIVSKQREGTTVTVIVPLPETDL